MESSRRGVWKKSNGHKTLICRGRKSQDKFWETA
jgi:hypothetical protein